MDPNTLAASLQQKIDDLARDEQEVKGLPVSQRIIAEQRKALEALIPDVLSGNPTAIQKAQEKLGGTAVADALSLESPSLTPRCLSPEEIKHIEQDMDRQGPFGG